MTNQEAIEMLTAKVECFRRDASGIDVDCNHRNCDECDLCYKQGTMGDQMEALGVAISALQAQEEPKPPASGSVTCISAQKMHDRPTDALISRQAAIDALIERDANCGLDSAEVIEQLPSVQPESTRTFVELVVEYPDPELCTYKEYKGKPYYSIKYIENGETYVGYGTYNPEVLSQYLKEYFISSAQPEIKPIDYQDCANAMLRMWMDEVVTDGEYNRIMDKLNALWRTRNEQSN